MEKNKKVIILNSLLLGTIILNLFIFTSRMRFFPWFIEDAWGYLGVFLTAPILIGIYFILRHFHKQQLVTNINKAIPLFVAVTSLIIVFSQTTDFLNIVALVINVPAVFLTAYFLFNQNERKK
ncbi:MULTISPECIES: hypothetical protein [Bacillus cereus group]|uniref:Group-specific protein n=1 Tax=Bacillus mycoides TaxID=1405 RepID=A0A1D3MXG2_BACMY|nr:MULTISPECIES: hypothetical protein [Bacillus cereus group]MBJ8190729.1 hypothetical protein [Bacillus cereus]OFD87062.1 hypothetical protein BWGOE11_57590 [Bacillus mycoides]OFD91153.1 hypothetical protein BWGOE13_55630 [Bacillus mycoides]OHX28613.1 hypothetical protein BWGOE5_54900 [Bacillus mycoides]SCM90608.1 Uncharacterized protein BWAI21_06142 [Bacillus mycoides]